MFLGCMVFAIVSNAQIVRSNSSKTVTTTVEKEPSESIWYMRLGLNMMKFKGEDFVVDENVKSNLGYNWVIGFEKPLGPLFWGMEFGLSSRGFKVEYKGNGYKESYKLFAHNAIFSPFNIGYKYPISDNLAVEAHLGAFVSGDYFGKWEEEEYGRKNDWTIYDLDDYIFPDAGMQFGFGMWFSNIGLDLCWQKGFLNITSDDDDFKSSNFMLRFGVAF